MTSLVPDPIIVFGAPRSGTTYLEEILNSHPDVFISHETRVFEWLHKALALAENDEFVLHHREAFVSHLRRAFPEVMRDFYRALAPDARYWGDKNPHYAEPENIRCLDLIGELFPGSRFIHIIRDGRDVVTSLMRKQAEGKPWVTSFEEAHDTWKWHVHYGRLFSERLQSPDRYFELRYEHLVADDPAVAESMFRFLGIDFHPKVDKFCRSQFANRSPFQDPMRDLSKGATASDWPEVFNQQEQLRSLELIGEDLTWYGYETEGSLAQLKERIDGAAGSSDRAPTPSARQADG